MPFLAINQLTPARVQWLWPRRLAFDHLAILDGDPGLGKSLVTLDICARITTGRAFPDGAAGGEPAPVLILNSEDGASDTIHGRLRAADADLSRVHVFERTPGEAFLRLPGHLDQFGDAVARTGARYVVLDPITSFLDGSVNLANDQSVRAALAPLADLARRHHCVIQMVRHLNKGSGKNPLYRGLYSIGFIASCRVSWLAARDPFLSNQFVLAQPKNNFDPAQAPLAYAIESAECGEARVKWLGQSTCSERDVLAGIPNRLRARMRAQDFLLAFLKDGPRTTREIWAAAEKHWFSRSTLDRARIRLKIESVQVNVATPQQTNWLLPGQQLPGEVSDTPVLDDWLRRWREQYPPQTPLDGNDGTVGEK